MKKQLLALLATTLLGTACAQEKPYVLRIPAQGLTATVTGHVALTPLQLDFGVRDVGTNSAAQSIQVRNDGAAPVTVEGISIVDGGGHFGASNNCEGPLAPGASCRIDVGMTPLRSGPLSGTLAAMAGGSTTLVDLTGAGTAATPAATPSALAFGTVAQGSMLDRTATLTNTGPGSLQVSSTALTGESTGFSIVADACSGAYLSSGGACAVTVRFTAADTLAHNATLHLYSSAEAPNDNLAVALSAAGGPRAAQVSPASLAFPDTAVGSTSASKTLTVTNPNTTPLTLGTLDFTQAQANFVRTGGSCVNGAALPAQGSCTVSVALAPQVTGSLTGTFNLPVGGTTLAVALSGTGTPAPTVVSILEANHNTFVLKSDNSLWAAGFNGNGELGIGSKTHQATFQLVATGVKAVSGGNQHTAMLKTDGSLWATGVNTYGQQGVGVADSGTLTWRQVLPPDPSLSIAQIAAGQNHTLLRKTDGSLWGTGAGQSGQLGGAASSNAYQQLLPAGSVVDIAASGLRTFFRKADNTLWGAGSGSNGEWGQGTAGGLLSFTQLATNVAGVAAGPTYTMLVKTDGTVWASGDNYYGQLGDGTTTRVYTFKQVASGMSKVDAGSQAAIAVTSTGSLYGTGNVDGAVRTTFALLASGVTNARAAATGAVAVKSDGKLYVLGTDTYGSLGGAGGTSFQPRTF